MFNRISKEDADTYMRRIGYVLTHDSLDQTIGEVVKMKKKKN